MTGLLSLRVPADVFIAFGQSNFVTPACDNTNLPPQLLPIDIGVQVYCANPSGFFPLNNGVNNNSMALSSLTNWGPEAQFLYLYRQDNPNKTVFLIKLALGGKSLAVDWAPGSALYTNLTGNISTALSALRSYRLAAALLVQGEQDATDTTQASNYQANLTSLITAIRADSGGGGNMKFIASRLPAICAGRTFLSTVRAGQVAAIAASQNALWVNTDSFTQQSDQVHFDAAGATALGAALYAAYKTNSNQ